MAQPIWLSGCLTKDLKQAKNNKNAFFDNYRLYVDQPGMRSMSIKKKAMNILPLKTNQICMIYNFRKFLTLL